MKGQYRTSRHCPPDQIPEHIEVLVDGVVYHLAKCAVQPEGWADNIIMYCVFVEDGLREAKNNT